MEVTPTIVEKETLDATWQIILRTRRGPQCLVWARRLNVLADKLEEILCHRS